MHEPPKSALARLKAQPQPSGNGPGAFPGGSHPDANLLAAFVERSLTERERLQVLEHLAACADCREVAVLTLPAGDEVAGPVRAPGRKQWNPWPVLRWGALAAVLGTVAMVVVLHPEVWRRRSVAWNETHPAAPAEAVVAARPNPPSPPVALPGSEAIPLKEKTEAKQSADELASMAKVRAPLRDAAQQGEVARAEGTRHVTMMAASLPPAPVKVENMPGTDAVRAERQPGSPSNAVAMPAPSPSSAAMPSGTPTSVGGVMPKAPPQPEAPPPTLPSASQTVEGTGAAGGGLAEATRTKGISSKSTQADIHVEAHAQALEMRALRKDAGFGAVDPPAEWSVSTKGKLCRSTDGGKTLEEVHVVRGVKLRAVAARGNDVWAGGTGGSLFHSTDRGATWKRSGINENTVIETIEAIQIHDALHITVTLATGEQWITEDAGLTWQKKP